jgi:hypothetical protein
MKDLTLLDIVLLLLVSSMALVVTSFPTLLGISSKDGLAGSFSCKFLPDQRHTAILTVNHRQALPLQTSILMSNGHLFEPLVVQHVYGPIAAIAPICTG